MEVQWKIRYSVAMCGKINFNKIEQDFINITSDLVVAKHARLQLPGMIISQQEMIMSYVVW